MVDARPSYFSKIPGLSIQMRKKPEQLQWFPNLGLQTAKYPQNLEFLSHECSLLSTSCKFICIVMSVGVCYQCCLVKVIFMICSPQIRCPTALDYTLYQESFFFCDMSIITAVHEKTFANLVIWVKTFRD